MAIFLTKQRSQRDPEKFPTTQLFLLAIVRLAEPVALTSIFPYAWQLVKEFEVGHEEDASFYAGLLISAFALAESLTGMYWGGLSDRVGRKPVLLLGCVGTMLSMIMVGFASNIWMALAGRAFGGFLNGNIGVIQTMVGELVTKPEHEPKAYSVMPFVWAIGTILGPAIGGTFAHPYTTYPDTFSKDGIFGRFPYLLPNLICAAMLLVSIIAGYTLLEETHPDMQPRVSLPDDTYTSEETPLMATADAIKQPAIDLRSETYGTFDVAQTNTTVKSSSAPKPKTFTPRIIALITALGIFTYHSMTFDHLLPIYLEDTRSSILSALTSSSIPTPFSFPGGLGLSVRAVGLIMSINGIISLLVQAVIFPMMASYFGIHRLFILVTLTQPLCYFTMPYLLYLPDTYLYAGIYTATVFRNLLGILAYPTYLILIKEAVVSSNAGISALGRINGLAASVGAASRTVAPPISGWLYGAGSKVDCTALSWWGSGLVAMLGALQALSIERSKVVGDDDHEEAVMKKGFKVVVEEVSSEDE